MATLVLPPGVQWKDWTVTPHALKERNKNTYKRNKLYRMPSAATQSKNSALLNRKSRRSADPVSIPTTVCTLLTSVTSHTVHRYGYSLLLSWRWSLRLLSRVGPGVGLDDPPSSSGYSVTPGQFGGQNDGCLRVHPQQIPVYRAAAHG